jgi:PKD repeat protein
VVQGLTPDKNAVKNKIDALSADGGTPLGEGLKIAIDHLDDQGRSNAVKAIILLTDGWWNMGCDPLDQADRAAAKGYTVYTIGWGGVNVTSLQLIAARTGGRAYFPATSNDLVEIYGELAEELSNITAQNVRLTMELTDEVVYAANPSEEPDWIAGNLLTWDLGTIAVDQLESISFDVEPTAAGTVQINTENSEVTYDDAFGVPQVVPVPQLSVKVIPPESQPVALFTVSNTTPVTNQSIVFDASASYDPDGFIEVYRWDFENDGVVDIEGNVVTITHSYTTNGTKTAKLEVVDNIGASDWVTKEITVTDGAGEAISGNVTWSGKHLFEGLGNREVIGNTVHIKATAYEITNNGDEPVTVTVELRVDGIPLTSTTATIGSGDKEDVIVYGEWVPMASGMHHISLHVYDGEYWVPPTNDPTAGVKVFIEKVI